MIPAAASAKIDYVRIDDDASSTPVIEVFPSEDQDGNLRYSTIKPAPLELSIVGSKSKGGARSATD